MLSVSCKVTLGLMHGQSDMQRDMWQSSGKKRGEVGWQALYKQDPEGRVTTDDSEVRILERKGRKKVFLTTQPSDVKEVVLR